MMKMRSLLAEPKEGDRIGLAWTGDRFCLSAIADLVGCVPHDNS